MGGRESGRSGRLTRDGADDDDVFTPHPFHSGGVFLCSQSVALDIGRAIALPKADSAQSRRASHCHPIFAMGCGASLPDTLDKATEQHLAGDQHLTADDAAEKAALDDSLSKAATEFDVASCRDLIGQGANAKHISRSGANDWYAGDSSTCLYAAVSAFHNLGKEEQGASQARYVQTVELLLEAGADADFHAQRGNWNRVSRTPLMDVATQTIEQMTDAELKKRLLLSFAKAGVQLNACTHRGKQGHFFGYGAQDYALFTLVRGLTPGSDLSLLAVYLDAGVNLNCSESSWSVEFRDDGEDDDEDRSHQTLLHAAIQTANADLVRLLVAHGADVNQNMVFSRGRRYYLMSCLQLAMEMKSADVIEVLRAARARERVNKPLADTVRMFTRCYDESKAIKYHEGGEGKFRRHQQEEEEEDEEPAVGRQGGQGEVPMLAAGAA